MSCHMRNVNTYAYKFAFYRCALEDAAMGVLQDELEGSTEVVAEDVADEITELATRPSAGGRNSVVVEDLAGP